MSTTNGQFGTVLPIDITSTMQDAYLDYAMSVIVARALPDVRDGLKPVHRRILYAMSHDLHLVHTGPHKKSARIVGEVLGKYHPHGDTAVYDAMVRMAQDFSLRYPLVDGQGNFGSIDGDNAAAMRYTEAKLAEISSLILDDLEKETVEWHDNFDNTLLEPDILPAALPNLLINGSSGIAVGMATNIPPHNLGEIVDGLAHMIDNYHNLDDVTVEDLLRFIKGPDFPTGGILYRFRQDKGQDEHDVISQGYSVGRGRLILQAKAHFEEMSRNRKRIVITELPYQTNKTALIERIASLVRDGKIEGITDLRDESDRTGMRIVIELTRNVEPKDILADLFKYTPLQQTFGMQMLALVDGQPRMLSLKRMLYLFIQHREEIIRRRSEYDLERARQRAHILEGLLKALDILDEVIATIRRSQRVDTARTNLMHEFKFTEIQAQAILDMQLRRLAALERKKLQEEYKELLKQIDYLEDLLAHPEKVLSLIKKDLLAIKEKYGDARRTQIVDSTKGTLTTTDLLPEQDVWVSVAANGDLKRSDLTSVTQSVARTVAKGSQVALVNANTLDHLYLFNSDGRSTRVGIHEIPLDNGKHLSEFTDFTRRDSITTAISLPRLEPSEGQGYLFFATELGIVKRVTLADFLSAAPLDPQVINVDTKDRLGYCFTTSGDQEVILVSSSGKSIRFDETEVRSMGLAAAGVGGMKLKKGERIVGAGVVDADGELMTITESGFAKRSALSDYSTQGRNGGGIVTHKPTNRTGNVTSARVLTAAELADADTLLSVITAKGQVSVLGLPEVPQMGRGVQGKQVMPIGTGDRPWAIHVVKMPPDDTPGNNGGDEPISESAAKQPAGGAKKATAPKTSNGARAGNGVSVGKQSADAQSANKPPQQASLDLGLPAADAARSGTSRQRTSKSGKDGSSQRNAGGDKDKPAPGPSPGRASGKRSAPKTGRGKSASDPVAAEKSTPTTAFAKSAGTTKTKSAKAASAKATSAASTAKKPPLKTTTKTSTPSPGKAKPEPKQASKAASSSKASSTRASGKTTSTASTAKKPSPSKIATKTSTPAPGEAKPDPKHASKAVSSRKASSTKASGKTTSTASTTKKPPPSKTATKANTTSSRRAKPGPKQAEATTSSKTVSPKSATGKAALAAPEPAKTRSLSTASKENTVPAIQVESASKSAVEPSPAKAASPKESPSRQAAKANIATESASKQTDSSDIASNVPPAAEDVANTAIGPDDTLGQSTSATSAKPQSPVSQPVIEQPPKETTTKSKKPSSKSRKLQIVTTVNKKPASSKKK